MNINDGRENEIIALFKEIGVLLEGHFQLTSGRHSNTFLQLSQLFQYPDKTSWVVGRLLEKTGQVDVSTVLGPAMGGIILAYEMAKQLGARAMYAEKGAGGRMELRRGFRIAPGERVLVVEDAVTTGGSVRKVIELVKGLGAYPVRVVALVDRSGGRSMAGINFTSLLTLDIPDYSPEKCPLCSGGVELESPKGR